MQKQRYQLPEIRPNSIHAGNLYVHWRELYYFNLNNTKSQAFNTTVISTVMGHLEKWLSYKLIALE